VRFLPEHSMMQKVHSGVVVHSEGTSVRIEAINLKVGRLEFRVRKLFRLPSELGRIVQDMKLNKLNKTKVRYILRQNHKG